jgi:hypothetical protein
VAAGKGLAAFGRHSALRAVLVRRHLSRLLVRVPVRTPKPGRLADLMQARQE